MQPFNKGPHIRLGADFAEGLHFTVLCRNSLETVFPPALLAITQPYYMLCTKCTYQNDQLSFLVKVIKLIANHVTVT